ncbi:hypothetical protein JIQ42_07593 [Leishmania sp. Namibia]|uniref:hypothetical protein n=1 Tax=Leishmania sp. Namibia TaxID=2802991 RepID=UPI001B787EAF|nr:hypothetical protein JIQ42_07593 [Leishmania sp. Namibia]
MRGFILFEAAALLLCWIMLLILTEGPTTTMLLHNLVAWLQNVLGKQQVSSEALLQGRTAGDALPEESLSLFWMRRAMTQPYRSWYLHDSETYRGVPLIMRLPKGVVAEGQILYPFHVLHLYACGVWLQWVRPDLAMKLFTPHEQPRLTRTDAIQLRSALAWVSAGCVVLVGGPAVWCLVGTLSRLLHHAVCERERASRRHLPADVCVAVAASGVGAPTPGKAAEASAEASNEKTVDTGTEAAGATKPEASGVAIFLGSVTVLFTGVLPLFVMEMCTMQPWCLCGSLLVWAVFCVLKDELQLHAGEEQSTDAAFDLATPVVVEGDIEFFAMKREPSVCPLIALSLTCTVMSLTMPSCLFAALLFFLWGLTACWQRRHRRVLVKLKLPKKTTDPSVDGSGCVRIGYSCYSDTLWMNRCFGCSTLFAVCLMLGVTTPWWLHQQPVLTFMDLFASPPKPSPNVSFTGGHELHPRCLAGHYSYYSCAQPTPNMWQLTEWFGLPWTTMAETLTSMFTGDRDYINQESPLWLNYIMLVLLAFANSGSILVLGFYRLRKPPLSFETPVLYATQLAERQAFCAAKQARRRASAPSPVPPAPQPTSEPVSGAQVSAGRRHQRSKQVTCLSREEYVVKQVVLMCWMLSVAAASGTMLLLHNAPSSCVLMFPCGSLLAAIYVVIRVLRCGQPLAFHPIPQQSAGGVGVAWMPKKGAAASAAYGRKPQDLGSAATLAAWQGTQSAGSSARTQQDLDDQRPAAGSRWCTTAVAPSLAHAADVSWVYLVLTASVLGTGALTWMTVPTLMRHGSLFLLGGCAAVSLALLRAWAQVDTTSDIFLRLGALSCVVLGLLLIAQAVPQSSASTVACLLVRFTDLVGDMYTHTGDNAFRALIYECAASCVLYTCCAVHATLRLGRLALEPEEVCLAPIEEELGLFKSDSGVSAAIEGQPKKER